MIGRNDEKKYLLSLLEEEDAQFVAVFGRRRIGKHIMEQVSYEACFFSGQMHLKNIIFECAESNIF